MNDTRMKMNNGRYSRYCMNNDKYYTVNNGRYSILSVWIHWYTSKSALWYYLSEFLLYFLLYFYSISYSIFTLSVPVSIIWGGYDRFDVMSAMGWWRNSVMPSSQADSITVIQSSHAYLRVLSLHYKLQRVQNAAARLLLNRRKTDHITDGLKDLHWLPITLRIQYKLCLLMHLIKVGNCPSYLKDMVSLSDRKSVV